MDRIITYAQNREDILLAAFFSPEEKGFYVDVGAEDPTELSVTKIFYDKGWRGINIEPIKRQFKLFLSERSKDINLNVGVADKTGVLKFREYVGSGYSTFSEDMKKEHTVDEERLVKEYKDYQIPVLPLKDIFSQNNVVSVQFLKIDVEGLEYEVLAGNDWNLYRPEVICIEANHVRRDWRQLLDKEGYEFVFFDGLNEFYCDKNTDRSKRFNYVKSVVFKEPIVNFRTVKELEDYAKLVEWLDNTNIRQKKELELAQEQLRVLGAALNDVTPLRRHIVKSVKRKLITVDGKVTAKLSHSVVFSAQEVTLPQKRTLEALVKTAEMNDITNFDNFNSDRKDNVILPIYVSSKKTLHRTARKIMHKVFRG